MLYNALFFQKFANNLKKSFSFILTGRLSLCYYFFPFFFRLMYVCCNIIYMCLLMAKSMFSADFANKL